MPVARPESSDSRVIAHIDMDCFYVQVEQRKQPDLKGKPTAVVQYNEWKGGGLIAVSYEARKYGVTRSMRGHDAKQVCPEIQLVQVPVARGKADLTIYRNAGSEVVSILSKMGRCERASIDEVYLDLTEAAQAMLDNTPSGILDSFSEEALKSHILGLEMGESVENWFSRSDGNHRDKLLAGGALLVAELRLQVLKQTEFTCSAGIAHNKMLAKLASGMNKPAQQTVVPFSSVSKLLDSLPIKKMKQLGGKLGTALQTDLHVETVGDLLKFSEDKLQEHYGVNTGTWLWNIARGISGEEVQGRLLPKSHGAGKTFPGPRALKTITAVENWIKDLCAELNDRLQSDLEQNKRIAHTLTLHASAFKGGDSESVKKFPSKSCSLRYGVAKIQEDAIMLFQAGLREYLGPCNVKSSGKQYEGWKITGLSVSASKIVAIPSGTRSINNYFNNQSNSSSSIETSKEKYIEEILPLAPSGGNYCDVTEPETESVDADRIEEECTISDSYQEDNIEVLKEKNELVASSVQDQNLSFVLSEQQEEHIISSAGAQSCHESDQSKSNAEYLACSTKLEEQKTKSLKEKEKSSILRFFNKHSPCSSKHENLKASSSSDSNILCNSGSFVNTKNDVPQNKDVSSMWSYKIDEIDHTVLNELPIQIQAEVRAWVQPQKRAKKDPSIAKYFLPTKET